MHLQQWRDSQIHWDPSLYDDIKTVHVPAKQVWIPEFYLYHRYSRALKSTRISHVLSVDGSTPLLFPDSTVMVKYTGEIRAFVPFTARALCPINVKYFPFDEQTCRFKVQCIVFVYTQTFYYPVRLLVVHDRGNRVRSRIE